MSGRICGLLFLCSLSASTTYVSNSITGSVGQNSATLRYRLCEPTAVAQGENAPLVVRCHAGRPQDGAGRKIHPIRELRGSKPKPPPHGGSRRMIPASRARLRLDSLTRIRGAWARCWSSIYQDSNNTLYPWLFAQHLDSAP